MMSPDVKFKGASAPQAATPIPATATDIGSGVGSGVDASRFSTDTFSVMGEKGGGGGLGSTLDSVGNTNGIDKKGSWTESLSTGVDIAKIGVAAFSAWDTAKMNDYLRDYYSGQEAIQMADYTANAKDYNKSTSLSASARYAGNTGNSMGSAENDAHTGEYMKKWGVSETV